MSKHNKWPALSGKFNENAFLFSISFAGSTFRQLSSMHQTIFCIFLIIFCILERSSKWITRYQKEKGTQYVRDIEGIKEKINIFLAYK